MTWQPIETAPRDGTVVLVFDANAKKGYVGDTPNVAYWDDDEPGWWGCYETEQMRSHTPTHWMPLPELPASGMEARQGGNEVPCEARQPDGEAGTP